MKFFNGDNLQIVLTPTNSEIEKMVKISRGLMLTKMEAWVLDQLTTEQLKNCIVQFQAELKRRNGLKGQARETDLEWGRLHPGGVVCANPHCRCKE